MTEAIVDFERVRNEFGAITDNGSVTQNDALFTWISFNILGETKYCNSEWTDWNNFRDKTIISLFRYFGPDGCPMRHPKSIELESHDNITAWGALAETLNCPEWAKNILIFARKNAWVFPTKENRTVFERWLGRHRNLEAHLQLATREELPDFITQLFWLLGVIPSAFAPSKNFEAYALSKAMVKVAYARAGRNKITWPLLAGALFWDLVTRLRGLSWKTALKAYGWENTPQYKWG